MELGIKLLKEYFTFLKAPVLEPHHQMQFSIIVRILVGCLSPLQTCSWRNRQPQLTERKSERLTKLNKNAYKKITFILIDFSMKLYIELFRIRARIKIKY